MFELQHESVFFDTVSLKGKAALKFIWKAKNDAEEDAKEDLDADVLDDSVNNDNKAATSMVVSEEGDTKSGHVIKLNARLKSGLLARLI